MKFLIITIAILTSTYVSAKDKREPNLNGSDQKESRCEDVNDQYVICNGVKYVRDTNNNDSLRRSIKEINEFIDSDNDLGPRSSSR